MNINVINYHATNACNYGCRYCFGKFDCKKAPSVQEAKRVIDNIRVYFNKNGIKNGRINFAGGEPTLYPYLDELIDYAVSLGIEVSIVTNGSLLSPERIRAWQGKVSCVGISVDSIERETNISIGRQNGSILELPRLTELLQVMRQCGISIKINTVVSKLNLNEDLTPLYRIAQPKKIKIFKMHLIEGVNDQAKSYSITNEELWAFVNRHSEFSDITVVEADGDMENSYIMINPDGELQLNNGGKYLTYGSCISNDIGELLKRIPIDEAKYAMRYLKEGTA